MTGIQKFMVMVAITGLAGAMSSRAHAETEALRIGASHSLKPAFEEILPMFEREYGVPVQVVYGPSQTLRRKIEQGAPIDVFMPESVEEVEKLERKGLTLSGGPRVYATSSLVLVMSAASRATPISLSNRGARIALGDPKTSALGEITARAMIKANPAYRNGSNFIYGQHTDEIMSLVESGKADAGIVHRVDAIGSGQMRIIDEMPAGKHTQVQFGEAVVWTCRESSVPVAEQFLGFMTSPLIQKLLLKYGFDPLPSNG
jgi:molybdate transport system substrate-binding protein